MLKRLLTAVLILTLFMVFTGTAFSAPKNVPGGNDVRDIVKAAQAPSAKEKAPAFKTAPSLEPVAAATLLSQRPHHNSANSADTMTCGEADYFSPAASFFVTFARRSNSTGSREFAMKFDGPPPLPNYKVKIDGTENWIYRIAEGVPGDGVAMIRVTVYNDNAGVPGTVAYSEVFAAPVHANTFNYTYFPFTNPPLVTGAYHISYKVDATSPSTDTVVFTSDDAGFSGGTGVSAHRSHVESAVTPGVWYLPPAIFAGVTDDVDFSQTSVYCNVYSSCYTAITPSNGSVSLWQVPDPAWTSGATWYGVGQRFVSTGPDTIKSVDFQHYDYSKTYGLLYPLAGTNGLIVKIWGDDGTGNIDYAAGPLATQTRVGGLASLFPTTGGNGTANGWNHLIITFATPPVVVGPWHVTVEMSSTNVADGALYFALNHSSGDPGRVGASVAFTAPDPTWKRTGSSPSWTLDGLGERAFFIKANVCSDEFSNCQHQVTYDGTLNAGFGMGYAADAFSRRAIATKVMSGLGGGPNRVEKIGFAGDDALFGNPGGLNGTPSLKVFVAADGGPAGPGSYIWSTTLTYAQMTPTINGWTEVVIPGGLIVANDFYVGYEVVPVDSTTDYFYGLEDRVTATHTMPPHVFVNGGMWQLRNNAVANFWQNRHAASGDYANGGFEVDFCSVPPSEMTCGPADNFATTLHDQGRTGHSNVALSDAYNDLTVKWGYSDVQFGTVNGAMSSAAPIVWNNFVVCMFGTKYVILDATTGALLTTITGAGAPNYITSTGSLNCTPMIASVTIAGIPTNVLFIAGGSTASVSAYNMDDPGFAQIWSINSSTLAAHGIPGAIGNSSYVNFVKLTLAGNERLFFATSGTRLYSVDAATGNLVWGPFTLDGQPLRGMATDGSNLFISTTALVPSNPEGDVYSINATTGAVNWQLSTAGGLKGQTIFGAANASNETFPNGIAYSGGELYTMSGFFTIVNNPADGVFYRINSTTGAVLSAVAGQCVYQGSGAFNQAALLVDAATILAPTRSGWTIPPLGNQMLVYNRFTGAFLQSMVSGDQPAGTYYNFFADGAMSCETGAPDYAILVNSVGYVSFFLNGTERFNRRIDNGAITARGAGVAIGADQSVYIGTYAGSVYKLTKQADRPRLEIVNYFPSATTYGPLPSVLVNFGKVFTNTGSGVLTGTITIDATSNGSTLGAPGQPNFDTPADHAASIADQLTNGSTAFAKAMKATDDLVPGFDVSTDRVTNRAAAALPTFINPASASIAFSVNAGDSANLILDVKQNAVNRGPNICYGWFASNDPDFFLNNTAEVPQVKISIVGGCLIDTTDLSFGAGAANLQHVTNTGRLGTGDWGTATTPQAFRIDGFNNDFYQGTYLYGVSAHRIALSVQDWWSGGGEVEAWISMQADPNDCTHDCKPALQTNVSMGQITADGLAYTNLAGSLVCRTYLDSVQNFGTTLANWNWILYSNALFDADSTMGLMVKSKVYGIVNAPAPYTYLNNATIDVMNVFQRYGLPLNNWKMSLVTDYDMGGDSAVYHPEISAGWAVPTSRPDGIWGVVKLPFGGCGATTYAPLKNVKALAREQSVGTTKSQATAHGNGWLDSAYTWMSQPAGLTSQGAVSGAGDQDFFATIIEHNFTANDTLQYALVEFGFPNMTNPLLASNVTPLATTLNKWVGYSRGDVNNDGIINLADIVYLAKFVNVGGSPGPIPFKHCGDVDASGGAPNTADVTYLINYYFYYGPCPVGKFIAY